jgi:hypothetical protein
MAHSLLKLPCLKATPRPDHKVDDGHEIGLLANAIINGSTLAKHNFIPRLAFGAILGACQYEECAACLG